MANKHNVYSQLLGGAENDPRPLVGAIPMSGVPDISEMADSMENDGEYIASLMKGHADRMRSIAPFQPSINDVVN